MPEFSYVVIVDTDTQEHADVVMRERIDFDERLFENGPEEDLEGRGLEIDYAIRLADQRDSTVSERVDWRWGTCVQCARPHVPTTPRERGWICANCILGAPNPNEQQGALSMRDPYRHR